MVWKTIVMFNLSHVTKVSAYLQEVRKNRIQLGKTLYVDFLLLLTENILH